MKRIRHTQRRNDNGTVLLEYVLLNTALFCLAGSIFFCASEMKAYGVTLMGFDGQLKALYQRLNTTVAAPVP